MGTKVYTRTGAAPVGSGNQNWVQESTAPRMLAADIVVGISAGQTVVFTAPIVAGKSYQGRALLSLIAGATPPPQDLVRIAQVPGTGAAVSDISTWGWGRLAAITGTVGSALPATTNLLPVALAALAPFPAVLEFSLVCSVSGSIQLTIDLGAGQGTIGRESWFAIGPMTL